MVTRIGNTLVKGRPLLRLTVCGIVFVRDALTGELVAKVPVTELDADDQRLIEAQPAPTEMNEQYAAVCGLEVI